MSTRTKPPHSPLSRSPGKTEKLTPSKRGHYMDVDAPTLSATKRKFSNVEEIRVTSTVDGRKVDLFKVPLFEMTQNTRTTSTDATTIENMRNEKEQHAENVIYFEGLIANIRIDSRLQLEVLEKKVEDLEKKVEDLEKKVEERDKKIEVLEKKVEERDKKVEERDKKIEERDKKIEERDKKIEERDKKIEDLEKMMHEIVANIGSAK
jgi:DNA repair exonuclease SbcCD ATPase subunit